MGLAADPTVQGFLELYLTWKALGALPRAGGLDDQAAIEVEALRRGEAAVNEYSAWRQSPPELTAEASLAHLGSMIETMRGRG